MTADGQMPVADLLHLQILQAEFKQLLAHFVDFKRRQQRIVKILLENGRFASGVLCYQLFGTGLILRAQQVHHEDRRAGFGVSFNGLP